MYKIYIVEDDKGIADGIKACLSAWEMEVREVSDFRNVMGEHFDKSFGFCFRCACPFGHAQGLT